MKIKKVLIVGGGTAGWMAACMLANHWRSKPISITLIESTNIGTIGVGEGSTPFLRDFFERMGISEAQWMPACDATYKCGIDFPGWNKDNSQSYFHPFYAEADAQSANDFFTSCQQRRQGYDTPCNPDDYFISDYLAKNNKSPITVSGSSKDTDYGYHFDAGKLGMYLAAHAKSIGVDYIQDDITNVICGNSNIASVVSKNNGVINADFFVDCSGLNGLLIQKALGESLVNYESYLANNSAVAISTNNKISTQGTYTLSKGLQHGWMWSIPLQSRVGNGYVYSSKHIDKQQAERDLRKELNEYDAPALHIHWQPGRINQHWKHNCLAVGLSQGFLEPLEAPMLNLVQQTLECFLEHIEQENLHEQRHKFNASINLLIDGTRDYLQAHYLLNTRTDSEYWLAARENQQVSPELKDIINAWDKPGVFEHALAKHAHKLAYGKTSWYCILAGMNRFSEPTKAAIELTSKAHKRAIEACNTKAKHYVSHAPHFAQKN